MPEALFYILALAASTAGLAWLALSMDVHWEQVRGERDPLPRSTAVRLRWLGAAFLAASLVWCMSLAGGALAVAFTLTWKARWLRPLVGWAGRGGAA